jgi:hypothetical protein
MSRVIASTTLVIDCNSRRADDPVCSCAYSGVRGTCSATPSTAVTVRVTYDWLEPLRDRPWIRERCSTHTHAKITYAAVER